MKKILTLLFTFFALLSQAQQEQITATVSGHVMLAGTTLAVPNHPILITMMPNDSIYEGITATLLSDNQGFYSFTGTINGSYGTLQVSVETCEGTTTGQVANVSANSQNIFVFDFFVCQMPDCQSSFWFYQTGDASFQFQNQSVGANLSYLWDFGDNTISTIENPLKTYSQNGTYLVSLSISNSDSNCYARSSAYLFVGDTVIGDCEAMFTWNLVNNTNLVDFYDMSLGNPTNWNWDFGDGSTSADQHPTHQYNESGLYSVVLSISNADGSCSASTVQTISVGQNTGCFAWFEPQVDPATGMTVMFNNMSQGTMDSFAWDFGDGSYSSEFSPIHTYINPGIYDVCLTISSNDSSCYDISCQSLAVGQTPDCLAQFTYYPNSDSSGNQRSVQFVDLSYGNLTAWNWSFGDGTGSTEQNPSHVFGADGTYQVCLTVNGENCQSAWCELITIGETEPDCFNYFTYTTAGNSVQFNGFHSSDLPASYQWDFGDGVTSLGNPMTHTYANPGVYFVNLTTWDDNQCMAFSGQNVVVGDSMAFNQVYGQVFEGTWPMANGFVMLFSVEADTNYFPYFDIAMIDPSGVYVFPFVPNGNFNLFAIPMDGNGYLPTYYESTLFWEDATVIHTPESSNPYNINLVSNQSNAASGNGMITGHINQAGLRDGFVGHVIVYLTNSSHQPLAFTEVASDGSFQFSGLAYGTYYVRPELAGVHSEYMRVDLSESQNEMLMNLTFTGNSFLGQNELTTSTFCSELSPNPCINEARFEFRSTRSGSCQISLTDLSGRLVMESTEQLNAGTTIIQLPVSDLQSGMYLIKIIHSDGTNHSKKLLKK